MAGAVVVTGASTGIGRAVALRLAGRGRRVFAGVRREQDGEALAAAAPGAPAAAPGALTPVILDVTDAASVAAAAERIDGELGEEPLAGLVNNAGITVSGPLEFLPLDDLRRQLEVNLVGQVAVTQALLRRLRAGRGRIVFTGSIGGRVPPPFLAPYAASKAGVAALAASLRQELRPWGIQVSTVEPGSIDTPIWRKGVESGGELAARLPAEAHDLYGRPLAAMNEVAAKMSAGAIPAERVAEVVERALTASRPRSRYLVGRDARIQLVLSRLLPDRAFDALVARMMGL